MIGVNNMKKTIISIVTLICILGLSTGWTSNNDDTISIEINFMTRKVLLQCLK